MSGEAEEPQRGFLVVRASGAAAAAAAILGGSRTAAPREIQLLVRCSLPRALAGAAIPPVLAFADCTVQVRPVESAPAVVMLTVPAARLTIGFGELRPLMFQPVELDAALRAVFAGAVAHVLTAGPVLDPRGLGHYLVGLAELVLRSALRTELSRVDALAARRRDAVEFIRTNLSDPTLGADSIAAALFISRRRLYQLFDDGQGVSERIKAMRLDHAKSLLADPAKGDRGIGEISRDCGFVSAAHFSRTFRKAVGQTPREFRERALAR